MLLKEKKITAGTSIDRLFTLNLPEKVERLEFTYMFDPERSVLATELAIPCRSGGESHKNNSIGACLPHVGTSHTLSQKFSQADLKFSVIFPFYR